MRLESGEIPAKVDSTSIQLTPPQLKGFWVSLGFRVHGGYVGNKEGFIGLGLRDVGVSTENYLEHGIWGFGFQGLGFRIQDFGYGGA